MKFMRFGKIIIAAAFVAASVLSLSVAANGQSINPTVEVTRRFEASLAEIHKSPLPQSVQDTSVSEAGDFSYSVFDRKFGGDYKFTPHRYGAVNIPASERRPVLSFDIGGGYPWASYAALDIAAVTGPVFGLSVFGGHYGYYGGLDMLSFENGLSERTGWRYDKALLMQNEAGIAGDYSWDTGRLYFGAGYCGFSARNHAVDRWFDSFYGRIKAVCDNDGTDYFYYKADAGYSYSSDSFGDGSRYGLQEHSLSVDISLGPVFRRDHAVIADISMDLADYGGFRDMMTFSMDFVPKYRYSAGRWTVSAGARLSWIAANDADGAIRTSPSGRKRWIFPAADVRFTAVRNYLWLELSAGGGNVMNRYSGVIREYRFFDISRNALSLQYFSSNPYDVSFSLLGSVKSSFSYDLSVAWGRMEGMPAFRMSSSDAAHLSYSMSADYLSARADLSFRTKSFEAGARVEYNDYFNISRQPNELVPAAFSGGGFLRYAWRSRLFVSVSAEFSGKWGNAPYVIPGWVDLGADVEYRFSEKLSVFLAGRNLLNETIQFQPLHAMPGINFVAGISVKL